MLITESQHLNGVTIKVDTDLFDRAPSDGVRAKALGIL